MIDRLSRYVRTGLLICIVPAFVLLAMGVILGLMQPGQTEIHPGIHDIISRVFHMQSSAFLSLGILSLYAAPVFGIFAALIAFAIEKDKRGVFLVLIITLLILISVGLGYR